MTYRTFLPSYYSALINGQRDSLSITNQYFFVADGVNKTAIANNNLKTDRDEQIVTNQIMYGGKLGAANVITLIRRVNWVAGKVFARYDSDDAELVDKDFYCYSSTRSVYKCIDNNNGAPSTIEPTTIETAPFKLADGYIWQFMYRLTETEAADYAIGNFIPVFNQETTEAAAIPGTVSTIDVDNGGTYNAIHSGNIIQAANTTLYRIDNEAATTNGIYNKSGFYIKSGPGVGSIAQITDYVANTSGRWVSLDRPISASISSTYDIAPFVKIEGNGEAATARAVMQNNAVIQVDVIDRGINYTLASASLESNTTHSQTGSISVNLSPVKGHGGDVLHELYAEALLLSVDIDNYTYSNLPINDLTFAKIGVLRNPRVEGSNTIFTGDSFSSTFTAQITPTFGTYNVGDTLSIFSFDNPTAKIVYANTTHVIGVYEHQSQRFSKDNVLTNQNGVTGIVVNIEQPDVHFKNTDILALINTDTITRTEDSKEILQVVLRIKQ